MLPVTALKRNFFTIPADSIFPAFCLIADDAFFATIFPNFCTFIFSILNSLNTLLFKSLQVFLHGFVLLRGVLLPICYFSANPQRMPGSDMTLSDYQSIFCPSDWDHPPSGRSALRCTFFRSLHQQQARHPRQPRSMWRKNRHSLPSSSYLGLS